MVSEKRFRVCRELAFWLLVVCAAALSAGVALNKTMDVSFVPINGDFQHYNMFRRLLDGQIPFYDFFNMLGNGVLFTNSALLALIGDTFANSVFCTHFTVSMAGFFIVTVLVFLFVRNKVFSAAAALCLALFTHGFSFFYTFPVLSGLPGYQPFLSLLESVFKHVTPLYIMGNASRPLRMTILYAALSVLILAASRLGGTKIGSRYFSLGIYARCAVNGLFAGLTILWANDYGVATYMGCSFALFLWLVKRRRWKQVIPGCLAYIAASVSSACLLATVIARGHFLSWLKATTSTSGNLWWYDNIMYDRKPLTLWQFPPFNGDAVLPIVFCLIMFLALLVVYFRRRDCSMFVLAHIVWLTASFFALYLYCLKDGYEEEYINGFEQYFLFALLWGAVLAVRCLLRRASVSRAAVCRAGRAVTGVLASVALLVGTFYAYSSVRHRIDTYAPNEYWVEGLGGNVTNYASDLAMTVDRLDGSSLFATYASAVETIRGEFHPAYSDYIIHVFGDEARQNYIDAFHEADPDYVSVISRDYTRWEAWVCNANWFFYREFIPNYRYEFRNAYARYLKKTEESNLVDAQIKVEVNRLDAASVELVFTSDVTDRPLILDAALTYSSGFTPARWAEFAVNRIVSMEGDAEYLYPSESFDCWFLPNDAEDYPFPVLLENGRGRVVLKSNPGSCTELENVSVSVLGAYDFGQIFGADALDSF